MTRFSAPLIGANGPDDLAGGDSPSRYVRPEEVRGVPGFLEDLPEVRREVAQYYTNVRRLDDCVGAVWKALKDEGAEQDTLLMFYGGDHGMSFPFAKSNDYESSSRGAFILRWPGVIQSGGVDHEHLVSTVDFTPTLLDAAGLPAIPVANVISVDEHDVGLALHGGVWRGGVQRNRRNDQHGGEKQDWAWVILRGGFKCLSLQGYYVANCGFPRGGPPARS